jgi:hypothetical protein
MHPPVLSLSNGHHPSISGGKLTDSASRKEIAKVKLSFKNNKYARWLRRVQLEPRVARSLCSEKASPAPE